MMVYKLQELAGSQVSSLLHPIMADQLPTYHRLNKFTRAFQVINDAYGVACYKEVNPGNSFFLLTSTMQRELCITVSQKMIPKCSAVIEQALSDL